MPTCDQCGSTLGGYGPKGLCPKCLLMDGFGEDDGDSRRFGDYELIEQIAHGGMGVVWKARQVSLNRTVAVKLMLAGSFASADSIRRFRAEAEAAASLQHPNIVAIHDIGEHAGQPFFSMDFVEGQNLAQVVRDRPLPAKRAAAYLKTIAEAVQYAHQRGILHRDLKPSNILVDAFDQPRITDFGLAKRLAVPPLGGSGSSPPAGAPDGEPAEAGTTNDLTLTGQVLGSPNYLPPEQAEARHGDIGPASDVYSLGAVLYCLLTGRAPFQAATVADTLKQVSTADPVSPRLLNPGVPRDLETICLKCLEKDIPRRYPTAQELAEELGRFLRHEPIRARPPGPLGKAIRWCRRQPRLAVALGATVLVFLGGFAGVTWQWRRAQAGEAEARRNLYTADIHLAGQALAEDNRGRALELLERHRPWPGAEDQRGWEWRYLWRQCRGAELRTLGELPSAVTGVAFSPDSARLAAGDVSGNLKIWRLSSALPSPSPPSGEWAGVRGRSEIPQPPEGSADGSGIWRLESEARPGDGINSLAFSPDGQQLLIAHYYRRGVDLWNAAEQRVVTTLRPRSADWPHHMAAFAPGGDRIAIVNDDSRFEVWDLGAMTNLVSLTGPKTCVIGIEWSPDGRWIAAGDQPNRIWLRDAVTFEKKFEWPVRFGMPIKALAFSPNSELLAFAGSEHTGRVWSTRSGALVAALTNHTSWVRVVAFAPDGRTLATGGGDQTIRLWDTQTWQQRAVLEGHQDEVHAVAFSPDGHWLASGGKDGSVKLWPPQPVPVPRAAVVFQAETNSGPLALALGPDGHNLAVWQRDGLVELWDAAALTRRRAVQLGTNFLHGASVTSASGGFLDHVSAFAVASGDAALAMGYEDGTLRVFDCAGAAMSRAAGTLSPTGGEGRGEGASGGSEVQREKATGNAVLRWTRSILDQPPQFTTNAPKPDSFGTRINKLAFSTDGRTLVSTSEDHTVRAWDAATGQPHFQSASPSRWHFALAISADGRRVAAGTEEGRIEWWHLPGGQPGGVLHEPRLMHIRALAFSPDGRFLASGSLDNRVRLWNLEGNALVRTFPRGLLSFRSVAFSPDGRRILAGAADSGEIKIWNLVDGEEVATLRGARGTVTRLQFLDADTLLSLAGSEVRLWRAASLADFSKAAAQ
jgi:WD40 repeat protein